ncbi:MAG: hypothetical protein K2G51_12355 [Lachnospiraceae bacterium]|nr:hypothetical protein [Lachnospiraceae bacterium]
MVRLIAYEVKKVFRIPALWGFFLLSCGFNILLTAGQNYERFCFNQVRIAAEQNSLDVSERDNVFAEYDTGNLSAFYADVVKESPVAARWMERKYALLQPRAEHLAESGAALDFYAGDATYESHQFLFGLLMRAILAEGSVCAMLAVLYLMGYEQINRTDGQMCTSRTGRQLWANKVVAALLSAVMLYILLAGSTLLFYFYMWDYSGVWRDSVSSRFNYLTDMLYTRPFFTWHDMTVGAYLVAALLLGAALVVVFGLMAAVCAMVFRNVYGAALVLALVVFGGIGLGSLFSQCRAWGLYLITTMQPAAVWLSVNMWFTEAGICAFLPWQETISVALNLMTGSVLAMLALRRFMRRDIV